MWAPPAAALLALLLAGCANMSKEHRACKKVVEQQCLFYGFARFDPTYRPANYEEMCNVKTGIPKLIELCLSKCGTLASKDGAEAQAQGSNKEYNKQHATAAAHKTELDKLNPEDRAAVERGEKTVPMVTAGTSAAGLEPDLDPGGPLDTLGYCVTHAAQGAGLYKMNEVHCGMVADWACPGQIDAPGCAQLRLNCQRRPCRGTRDEFKRCIAQLQRPLPQTLENRQHASRLHLTPGAPQPQAAGKDQTGAIEVPPSALLEVGDGEDAVDLGRSAGGSADGSDI